jgi:hypothetical protein
MTGGSYADHLALAKALGRYEQAERLALLFGRDIERMADRAHEELTRLALLCGHDFGSGTETVLSFSKNRVETFCRISCAHLTQPVFAPKSATR